MSTLAIAHHRARDNAVQPLAAHLFGVAKLAALFAQKISLEPHGELIGLLHDLGKYSEAFQNYLKSAVELLNPDEDEEFVDAAGLKGKIDHSTAGGQFIWAALAQQGQLGQVTAQILALCVVSHHSGLIDCISPESCDVFSKRLNKLDVKTHMREAISKVDAEVLERAKALLSQPELISGFKSAIARVMRLEPEKDKSPIAQQKIGLLVRMLFSCLIDADRIDSADFEKPNHARLRQLGKYADWAILCERLEQHLARFKVEKPIDVLRADISQHCLNAAIWKRGIYTLTVPTGGGKTLASLRFALQHAKHHQMHKVIYVIPFTSIIDQNAKVVREILEPEGVQASTVLLEHHSNLTPEQQSWRSKMLSENWDAPVIYTTMVQLLESLFGAGTRGARRMHQLANSVLIFDEIQTLPINCVHLFNNAMNFLVEQCNSSVLLCTATQPLLNQVNEQRGALRLSKQAELMPDVKQLFNDLKRVEVLNRYKSGGWTDEEIAALAIQEVQQQGSCLVIVNTKQSAQRLYALCDVPRYHLSTSMCPAHRKLILKQIRERLDNKQPVLCISTQLIEAGVDVDFAAVIRFMAGLDSIAQAAGRCNRHGLRAMGRVHVVNPQHERIDSLRDIVIGRDKAEGVLKEYQDHPAYFDHEAIGVKAMARYYQCYFFERQGDMSYTVTAKENGRDDSLWNMLAHNTPAVDEYKKEHQTFPNLFLRQSFMSAAQAFKAIDAPTQGVIVQYGEGREIVAQLCAEFMPDKAVDLLHRAQQYTVNVFPNVLKKLQDAGALRQIADTGILYLDECYYSAEFGLSETPVNAMEVLCV